jgi:hypothetical protein
MVHDMGSATLGVSNCTDRLYSPIFFNPMLANRAIQIVEWIRVSRLIVFLHYEFQVSVVPQENLQLLATQLRN